MRSSLVGLVVADRVSVGLLEDLRPLLEARGIDTHFPALYGEAAASEVCLGDGIYGVPLDSYLRVQLVNKTVIAAAGMDPNEFDPDRGAMSFDRLGTTGLALHSRERTGGLKRAGFIPFAGEGSPYTYLVAYGSDVFANCVLEVADERAQEAATWVQMFCEASNAEDLIAFVSSRNVSSGQRHAMFLRGEIVATLGCDWDIRSLVDTATFDVGATYVPVPRHGGTSVSWMSGAALAAIRGSKNLDAVMEFFAFMSDVNEHFQYVKDADRMPTRVDVSSTDLAALKRPAFITDHVWPNARAFPAMPIAGPFYDLLNEAWSDITIQQAAVTRRLRQLKADGDELLKEVSCAAPTGTP